MKNIGHIAIRMVFTGALLVAASALALGADPMPKGFSSFGPDQTIADIGKVEWQPLKLEGLPPGIEIATLRAAIWERAAAKSCFDYLPTTPCRTTAIPAMSFMSG